ncbi:glycine cleavage system protein GcvH [Prosthecochloris sp. HL-130-GSB]|jgi:glycine cleavage system H protein|uniref:Glycine cleavage system H protein n=1 Tax=Prosthecochloris aestuarii TaxID=1102 RepID=A0A831STT1_PROAE|nr:glycine cleavage system protein GcvH [Prosthecochloris sp. HL-130-GSB]ARM30397.1 glycine cleavage system protein H [Prosthecochloris sp. HL-130-GSB]MBO8092029.1 glycine cleavage system protein GcvH [Prosthecochloris sp.]HED31160.1 glycine cleavage system protein GcvH [Prosthecochloris aestuarii]
MNIPEGLLYTKDHEWVKVLDDGQTAVVGITDFAQSELGDIVFVETKPEGTSLAAHDVFGTVEAVKTVADLFAPVDGEITEVNGALDEAEVVNSSPYGDGWMVKISLRDTSQLDGLMSAAEYREMIGE